LKFTLENATILNLFNESFVIYCRPIQLDELISAIINIGYIIYNNKNSK